MHQQPQVKMMQTPSIQYSSTSGNRTESMTKQNKPLYDGKSLTKEAKNSSKILPQSQRLKMKGQQKLKAQTPFSRQKQKRPHNQCKNS